MPFPSCASWLRARQVGGLLLLLTLAMPLARAGLSFDTGAPPEEARDLLASAGQPTAPADSWLRIRNMDNSFVHDGAGAEIPLWAAAKPEHSLAERRAALEQLQAHGFHLVALLRWNPESWPHGVRTEHPLRRLPIDLRDAFDRCRALAASYGDLIDYWEIDNEPDISFVEENPETYAAFLKACYLGIAAGRSEGRGRTTEARGTEGQKAGGSEDRSSDHPTIGQSGLPSASGVRPPASALSLPTIRPSGLPPSISARSRVLMAPLALPPGPYLTAFIANGGLRYTDGFNYHYYGYAEDFTGVYEQFRDAVTNTEGPEAQMIGRPDDPKPSIQTSDHPPIGSSDHPVPRPSGLPANVSILSTRFYPNTNGWSSIPVFNFDFPATDAAKHRAQLEARPLAEGEPKLIPQGRWLVSSGVTVEETPGSWRIRVDHLPAEPMRPAMAELPLPDGWRPDLNALLSFAYRTLPQEGQMVGGSDGPTPSTPTSDHPTIRSSDHPSAAPPTIRPSDHPIIRPPSLPLAHRELPVFLTEYGYGLLSKEARDTSEGRVRQASWFKQVQSQIHALGIARAMAFLLKPYLENDHQEFGLLMPTSAEAGRPDDQKSGAQISDHPTIGSSDHPALRPSPALSTLIANSVAPITAQAWSISEPLAQTAIVIDFVAGAGLNQSKNYTGYLARGDFGRPGQPAAGRLILYNFGSASVTGDLQLEGDSWALADTSHTATLTLAPNERRELPVLVNSGPIFAPQSATATFRPSDHPPIRPSRPPSSDVRPPSPNISSQVPSQPEAREIATATPGQLLFDVYLRTANGNLFSLGSQNAATEIAQRQIQRLGNTTMAFFNRARLPWSFAANEPASLVFFLRPTSQPLPIALKITGATLNILASPSSPR